MKKFEKILIVDDEEVMRMTSKFVIEEGELASEIIEAPNGAAAIELLLEDEANGRPVPDLIVLDLQMPVMDGLEFIEQLPSRDGLGRLLDRVVVVSASVTPQIEQKVKARGVKWVFPKPISPDIIQQVAVYAR